MKTGQYAVDKNLMAYFLDHPIEQYRAERHMISVIITRFAGLEHTVNPASDQSSVYCGRRDVQMMTYTHVVACSRGMCPPCPGRAGSWDSRRSGFFLGGG